MKAIRYVVFGSMLTVLIQACSPFSSSDFKTPPVECRPIPLWFWNNTAVDEAGLTDGLEHMIKQDCYGGCAILPFGGGFSPDYLSEEYFALYGKAVSIASQAGAKMSIYDEYGFPSGSMGASNGNGVARFKNAHPGKTLKRLDKTEYEAVPGERFSLDLGKFEGKVMAVAAYDPESRKTMSLRRFLHDMQMDWKVPSDGKWKAIVFTCVEDGDPNVDYLDSAAVSLFVQDTHEQYYRHFAEEFGKTITSTFFDEPTLYRCGGRVWTESFNDRFRELYGTDPDSLYVALWYDIGEKTAMARNMMFGTRARMYSEGFMRTIAEWATEHGILSTGHQDQEEVLNPTSVAGDLMLDGKYMTMPGIDKIGGDRPAENFYKVVSSSANNWDHPLVMSETYGAMGNIPIEEIYRIAIEQYTKGINNLIPHAVWYNDGNVTFLPELSWRNDLYNKDLPGFNMFLGRLNYMLARPGRHVADIAVVYPIQTQQGGHYLDGALGNYKGGVEVPGTDYNLVSAILTDELGRDFTYLHPEVLDDRCSVEDNGILTMANHVNTEHFSTVILPGMKVISIRNLELIKKACESGIRIIFTTQTPSLSAYPDASNEEIQAIVSKMLESDNVRFVADPTPETLGAALSGTKPDVSFAGGHPINYIHKVIEGKNVYYFGNIDSTETSVKVTLSGNMRSSMMMNPHTGEVQNACLFSDEDGTRFELDLKPQESVFVVEK